jgi:hypothetical protein
MQKIYSEHGTGAGPRWLESIGAAAVTVLFGTVAGEIYSLVSTLRGLQNGWKSPDGHV